MGFIMTDSIDEGEFIDLCEQCGKWDQDNHLCQPNNGEYTTVEWKAILETRKRVALRQARPVIQERRAQIEAEENNLRELGFGDVSVNKKMKEIIASLKKVV